MFSKRVLTGTIFLAACVCFTNAQAGMYDLTGSGTGTATINGAQFYNVTAASTGSGVIHSFVRLKGGAIEQGYNTDGRPLQFDENTSATFTRSLELSLVPIVTLNGVAYREFLLDINQDGSSPLVSLDTIRIFQNSSPSINSLATLDAGGAIYNLDAGGDNWIKLDYSLNHGSGSGDMFAYVPNSAFGAGQYVYLYSKFGETDNSAFPNNDGFEEWSVVEGGSTVVPLPGAALLGLLGLGAAGLRLRRAV